jgi:electron transfer flavoprotein beta subunit
VGEGERHEIGTGLETEISGVLFNVTKIGEAASIPTREADSEMKILVCVKRVLDPQVKARVKADGSGVDLANAKMTMNPFCENALEEALRMREAGNAEEIIVASVGGGKTEETLRHGLAMGADRAIQVVTEDSLEPLAIAKVLKHVAEQEGVGLAICGKQAIDDDSNQTTQMLSALLGWSQATFASEIKIEGEQATVTREVDAGLETIQVKMPAVMSADLRLNEPRYVKLPDVMKAKRKPMDKIELDSLGLDTANRLTTLNVEEPEGRAAGVIVNSVSEMVEKLRNEAKVI